MRTREREKVSRDIRELAAEVCPQLATRLSVVWARELPDAYGMAIVHRPLKGILDPSLCDLFLCEPRWVASSPEERADTVAHELAHLVVWCLEDPDAQPHGAEWAAHYNRFLAAAQEVDW